MIYSSIDALEESSYDTQIYKAKKDNYYQLIDGSGKAITKEEIYRYSAYYKENQAQVTITATSFHTSKLRLKTASFALSTKLDAPLPNLFSTILLPKTKTCLS